MIEKNWDERYLLVVSGPSGIGKDTVVKHLIENYPGIQCSVSATTRTPRAGEKEGESYYYLTRQEFEQRVANDEFVEYAEYAGNYYGTLKSEIQKRVEGGNTCVLVIEVEGAGNIKRLYPDCTTVFLLAPSMEEHERRLRSRGSESEESIARRLAIAKREMKLADNYDFQLVNDEVPACAERLYQILKQRQA